VRAEGKEVGGGGRDKHHALKREASRSLRTCKKERKFQSQEKNLTHIQRDQENGRKETKNKSPVAREIKKGRLGNRWGIIDMGGRVSSIRKTSERKRMIELKKKKKGWVCNSRAMWSGEKKEKNSSAQPVFLFLVP